MTGLDCLREEMQKRGFNKAQIQSKIAAAVLDILANTGTVHTDIVEAENKLSDITKKYHTVRDEVSRQNFLMEHRERELKAKEEKASEYIQRFNESLSDCETPEGRDALKRAQMFVNSVTVQSKYDNTAFIIGLSAILSDGKISAIEELKKMNPKLFEPNTMYLCDKRKIANSEVFTR